MNKPIFELKDRLRNALNIRDMKPVELSEVTGIPKAAISQYMSGYTKPKDDRVFLICNALNINEPWLLGYDVPMERNAIIFEDKVDDTPYNRALAKLSKNETLTEYEAAELKRELPKVIEHIPDALFNFEEAIDSAFEKRMLAYYKRLNADGKAEALKRIEELTCIYRYTDTSTESLNAAHEHPGATAEEKTHDDKIMNDEDF